jgi:GDPmannose 4,6-dehydratase
MKRALITGVTGQDGSYLAELLLAKGYEVHGVIRRSSSFNTDRIEHLYRDPHEPDARLRLHYGDLNDASGIQSILAAVEPSEIYNLGAQSHVRVSFDTPEYTGEVTGLGALRVLEAVRRSKLPARVYQASSSEMFGSAPPPQSEATPFHPRSPYAAAKAYAFHVARNYREAYGLYVSNGILFNHECLSSRTPLVVRAGGVLDVCGPGDLVPLRTKGPVVQTFTPRDLDVWDGSGWTRVRAITATKRRASNPDHALLSVQARAGIVEATGHHRMLDAEREPRLARELTVGARLALSATYPDAPGWTALCPELGELLGLMAAEGYVPRDGGPLQFTSNDERLRDRVAELWSRLFLGSSHEARGVSGFAPGHGVGQLYLNGGGPLCAWLRGQLYTRDAYKKVPPLVLNGTMDLQQRFLDGYYAGDGLKAGNGDSVKTNSAVLAQGLCWLYHLQGRQISVYVEHRAGAAYFTLNLSTPFPQGAKGQHLRKDPAEVRRLDPAPDSEWLFDIETESGILVAGVGKVLVKNSPRRGETFVTRKITRGIGRIQHGLQSKIYLGNLDAKRDWGYAPDYVEAMWRMLQQAEPADYVIGTGETHSVREFLELACARAGLDPAEHVAIDPRYFRPSEVECLLADASKARRELGWAPTVGFGELVERMVQHDLALAAREKRALGG